MASINWQKQTKQKAGAMKKHNGQQERLQYQHENKDIDKSLTPNNYCIGCDDYNTSYERMIQRVKEVDELSPPVKITSERKICCSLETPCPLEITQAGRSREFFNAIHDIMLDFFGQENVHGACVHLDEVHDYIDEKTGELKKSLEHSTELVSCYAEWQDPVWERDENGKIKTEVAFDKKGNPLTDKDGNLRMKKVQARDENGELMYIERKGINGKHFETRESLKKLNDTVCDMVRQKFGIEFNTGEQARGKTVETLKAKTAEKEIKQNIEKLREKALEYEPLPKKFLETDKAYEERLKVHQQAVAVKQKEKVIEKEKQQIKDIAEKNNAMFREVEQELTARKKYLDQREQEIENEISKRCDERLARSDKYERFRTNQHNSQAFHQKVQTLIQTAKERNEINGNHSTSSRQNSSSITRKAQEKDDR